MGGFIDHQHWMRRALMLSYYAKGTTSPNPTVGALLLDVHGGYVDCAVTQSAGSDHAERKLLKDLDLSQTRGGILFVTLEPCCFQGRTPACTDIIIEKEIRRVFVAVLDPNPKVSGLGVDTLRKAGIYVEVGLCEWEAKQINKDFFYAITSQMPFVFAKVGLSLDGFMATATGKSQWITSKRSRRMGHILRYRADAILVGANTAAKDNPRLTARPSPQTSKTLLRIVLGGTSQLSDTLELFCDQYPTLWVVKEEEKDLPIVLEIAKRESKEIYLLKKGKEGFTEFLEYLFVKKNIVSLMLEGGSGVFRTFLDYEYLQEIFLFYGGIFLGNGLSPFPLITDNISDGLSFTLEKAKLLGGDLMVYGAVTR